MKKLLNTLSLVACILGSSLSAQNTSKSTSAATGSQVQIDPSDSKSKFINNQNYLSPSSLKDYRNFYGDSLKGFNEAAVRIELSSRYYYGQEFIDVMAFRKRDFIDAKYKLGYYAARPLPATPPKGTTKPIGGTPNSLNIAPCVNEDFELTPAGIYNNVPSPVTGWTVESTTSQLRQMACGLPIAPGWALGSAEFSIVATPVLGHPFIGNIPNSPLGGNNVAVLNNTTPGFLVTRISTTFPVSNANVLFQFAYAGSWDGSGHACCDQPFFMINMYDCNGAPLGCSSVSLTPPGPNCPNGVNGYSLTAGPNPISWCNWQVRYIDLTPYIGQCVTMRITNGDCNGGAHHGSLYFDARCGGSLACTACGPPSGSVTTIPGPVSFCAGSGQAQITAPAGYATYSWVAPANASPIPAAQATLQTLFINNPVVGTTYTVNLVSQSGCLFTSLNTIAFSTVNIAGIAAAPSCAGGASGTATVIGNGSGTGYNYTWRNATNSVVSTASVATGLPPGIYSITISGFGNAGCGSASATTTIGTTPPGVINQFKPFCGNIAYISTAGGSNFQWYNGGVPVNPNAGGNLPSYTVSPPSTGQIITLTYLSNLGCQDSVRFTLAATNPGFLTANNISWVCPGGNNGTANINLVPAQGSPPGLSYISVVATGTTPAFNANTIGNPNASALPLTGLSAGNYTATAFDGSCYYGTSFQVQPFTFTYAVSPTSPTLCAGNSVQANLTFSTPPQLGQYSYAWSPSTWLIGSNANVIVNPVIAIGSQSTIVYTVVVTPSVINCPVVRTLTITAIHPAPPTFTVIPNLCDNSAPYQIQANPAGGTFKTLFPLNSPVSQNGGVITASHSNISIGVNTFTYAISINTCVATSAGTYHVSRFVTSALSSSVPPLCVTSPPFNLNNIVQNPGGTWSGTGVSANQFSPANLITAAYQVSHVVLSTPIGSVCPSTTTLNVAVTNTISPAIASVQEFCTNASTFALAANPAGGGWLPVNGLTNSGIVTPGNITVNSLVATYTVNIGPCLNTNTTVLSITRFNSAALSGTVNNLCYNSSPVNLLSISQNTSGNWAAPAGVQANFFSPAGLATGIYTLTYHVPSSPNLTLCADSRTLAVYVLNPPTPTITQVGPYCNTASPFQLAVSPSTGHWTGASYLSASGMFTPALSSIGNNAIQYIIGTNGCNRQETKQISIEAFVPATITSSIPDLCNNSPVLDLGPFTLNNLGTWSGTGITGTNFNPATAGAGNFTLSYHTASSPGSLCPDQESIAVQVYSLTVPAVTQIGPYCNSASPVQLQVSPIGGIFGGAVPGVISINGQFNPAFAQIGNNVVNYSITSGPCQAFAQTTIRIEKFVSAGFEKVVGPFCRNSIPVNLDAYVTNPGGKWSQTPGNTGLQGISMFNPALVTVNPMTTITYETNSQPTGLCPDKKTATIEVRPVPQVSIPTLEGGCAPADVSFSTPSVNSGEATWTINDGSAPVIAYGGSHVFTNPGTYYIQLNYTDAIGCKAEPVKSNGIRVYASPKADFSVPEEIYISEPQAQLTNLSQPVNNNTYQWNVGTTLYSGIAPLVTFTAIGKYQVTLTATSAQGCKDAITKTLEVKNNFSVFMPNTFSPNFDGLNDVFLPVYTKEGLDPNYFEMEIFDRWGHSLYRTKDISKGWDGLVKGESYKEDIYMYKVNYKDADGNAYEKMGSVTLVK